MSFYSETEPFGGIPNKTGSLIAKRLNKDGNRIFSVETEPSIEPVTVDEVKIFAKIDYDAEDSLLESFVTSVRLAAEDYTGRSFIERTILMLMDYWPGTVVEFPRPPLISITKVATLGEDGTETEYSSDNYYVMTSKSAKGKLVLKRSVSEPVNTERDHGGYMVRFKAGYGADREDIPQTIREGIKAWVSDVHRTRKFDPKNPPGNARLFLDLYRTTEVMVR